MEERLVSRESAIEARSAELDKREQRLNDRLDETRQAHERHVRELERISNLSARRTDKKFYARLWRRRGQILRLS